MEYVIKMPRKKTKQNVLAVGAHSDDIEIGCGGAVAKHVQNGDRVIMLVMTKPAYTSYDGRILRDEKDGRLEEEKAAEILGAELINLGFETKYVPYSAETIEPVNEIIDKNEIDIIYTHWLHDTHQDHARTSRSVLSAGRYVKNIVMYEPSYPAGRSYLGFRNQYYVDIGSTFELKMKALEHHRSQVQKYGDDFLEAIKARAIHRGYEIGGKHAECFEVLRLLGDL